MTTSTAPPTQRPLPPSTPPRRRRSSRRHGSRLRYAGVVALFLAPSLIPLTLFTLVPMVSSLWVALHDWNLITPMEFVGLANFRELLADGDTWAAFGHTLGYIAGYLPLVYLLGLGAALALNTALRGRNVLRAAYFLPVVTSWVVVALLWRWLLSPANGLVNHVLGLVGIDGPGWWTDPAWAMPSVILASAWKDLGFVMIILLAGLQAIPGELYDAARVDGTSTWQRFRHVTLPLLSPSTFFVVVISLINGFQVFDQVYVMTGGGPLFHTDTLVTKLYRDGFTNYETGYAAATSWVLFIVVVLVSVFQLRIFRYNDAD